MYWGWDQLQMFMAVWIGGAVAFVLVEKLTRKSSHRKRIFVCALVLAVALTPSILIGPGFALAPAAYILAAADFVPPAGFSYALWLGALPIIVVWLAIAGVWATKLRRG